ncbi:autophagy protein [Exophiala bonariae]|uniref:Autophagy protein n=1 Tax=Exophiala bonariae TaxID=1690606 RepID=A0AAV9MSJ7_9EURO|nr:autophagy protein [Exophiala bonariae]
MKLLYTIETSPNPTAICALSPSSENCFLAYPLPQKAASSSFAPPSHAPPNTTHVPPTSGEVLIFDAVKLEAVNVVEAHRSPLSCVIFNNEGTVLATASDKGTIIRVFSVPDAHKLYQFRRGSMPSRIFSMAFNITSTLLCVSSATETIHIFKLGPQTRKSEDGDEPVSPSKVTGAFHRRLSQGSEAMDDNAEDEDGSTSPTALSSRRPNGTFMGLLRRTSQHVGINLATTVGGYLPKGVAEMWEPSRDFAWIRLPRSASGTAPSQLRSVVAMSSNSPQVMVVTNEGNFYVFNIDLAKGGEGTLTKQYSVLHINDKLGGSSIDY